MIDFVNAFVESIERQDILIDKVKIPKDNCEAIAEAIRNGTACLITDGSYFPEKEAGSSAFILTPGKTKRRKLIGMNWVPGTKEEQDPYRSELAGINGGLSMIAIILTAFDIIEGKIEIALDGLSALRRSKDSINNLKIMQSSYDILQDTRNRIKKLPAGIDIK